MEEYNLDVILQLIGEALTSNEFNELALGDSYRVYQQFTDGQSLSYRRCILVEDAEKHREVPKLLEKIQQKNPTVYKEFQDKLTRRETPSFSNLKEESLDGQLIDKLSNVEIEPEYLPFAQATAQPLQLLSEKHADLGEQIQQKIYLPTFKFETITVNSQGKIIETKTKIARYYTEELGNSITIEMVYIPGGKFTMGSPDTEKKSDRFNILTRLCEVLLLSCSPDTEKKSDRFRFKGRESRQHEVVVSPFFMGKFQVTQAQWRAIASLPKVKRDLKPNPSRFKGRDRPVERVSWHDAVEFCERLSRETGRKYRLPNEAEWEFACRAGTTTPFYFGETITTDLVNYCGKKTYGNSLKGEYRKQTTSVGSFPPNTFGLYNMHGNVWEWCAYTWPENYRGRHIDGSTWLENYNNNDHFRLLRGGSWQTYPVGCRSASRPRDFPGLWDKNIGFRVVCGGAARTQ